MKVYLKDAKNLYCASSSRIT